MKVKPVKAANFCGSYSRSDTKRTASASNSAILIKRWKLKCRAIFCKFYDKVLLFDKLAFAKKTFYKFVVHHINVNPPTISIQK